MHDAVADTPAQPQRTPAGLFVDTCVWSLALRRDSDAHVAVDRLRLALESGETVATTGLVLQELLQGFAGPKARTSILERFRSLELLRPEVDDHVAAAHLRNRCRRGGVQIGTVDALLAQLCIAHSMVLLTSDQDFFHMAPYASLRVWRQ